MSPAFHPPLLAAGLFAVAVAGCGGGVGTLSGKVTYQGKPVVYGTVLVRCADGLQRTGNIEPDGSYAVLNVPAGPVKIGVESPQPPAPAAGGRTSRPGSKAASPPPTVDRSKWVKLPDDAADPEKSGIATTVPAGGAVFDIALP